MVARVRKFAVSAVVDLVRLVCGDEAKLFEDGCGFNIPFSSAIMKAIQESEREDSSPPANNFSFTLCDMSGVNLKQARQTACSAGVRVERILFRDLLTTSLPTPEYFANTHDAYLSFFVWHQTCDSNHLDVLRRNFQFALNVVRPGGFLSITEPTSANVNLEILINLVDREGYIPDSLFLSTSGLTLQHVMVPFHSDQAAGPLVKIPWRLPAFSRGFGFESGNPLYVVQSFLVITVPMDQLPSLQNALDQGNLSECTSIFRSTTPQHLPFDQLFEVAAGGFQ